MLNCPLLEQKSSAERLFQEFEDVFSRNSSDIGHTTVTQHRIDTEDHPPIKQHPRRLPFAKQEEVGTLLREMQENDIIEPSSSPWASPIVLVRKKDGSTRFCVDYRKLNDVTKKDSYPLPRIDDTLDTLSGHKWFSTLDLKSGYWQVEIHPEDREKQHSLLAKDYGSSKSHAVRALQCASYFRALMETVLKGLTFEACLIYLDDVIIGGRVRLKNIFKISGRKKSIIWDTSSLQKVFVRPRKSVRRKELETPLKTSVSCEASWDYVLITEKFVKGFSNIARPLHKLTESKQKFQWTKECEDSFLQLKEALTSSPILIYPQPDKPFILDTDASNESVGAVLSQEIDGQERVVAYWKNCRHCSRVETKYDYAIRQITTSTATPPDPWSDEKVQEDQMADPDIKPLIEFMESSSNKPSWQDISAYSPTTKQYWALWNSLYLRNGVLYRKFESEDGKTFRWQLVLPRSRIPEVLKELHGSPTGGHYCVMKTLHRVRERFFWGKVRADVEQWCKSCDACSARKGPKIRSRGKLHRYNVGAPFERIAFDILGPLPRTVFGNSTYLLSWTTSRNGPKCTPFGSGSPHRSGGCSAALDIEIWGTSSTSFRSGKKFRLCGIEGGL
ncbi:retrovirus-related Pol polyprotein from transposon 412 [Trichonephila clavipes]|nr:retrovirus-related Pol polyprotein from transposon 412 [Trichonephila clavipes]